MARIFRQTYTIPLPDSYGILNKNGKRYAKYKNKKGKTIEGALTKNGKSVLLNTKKWYIEYKDEYGVMKAVPGFTDRKATEYHANQLVKTAERIRCGYRPKESHQLSRPLLHHLKEYREYMLNKGTSQGQVNQVYNRASKITEECGFEYWADIKAFKIQEILAMLRRNTLSKRGISRSTSNGYLQAIKSFCKWLEKEGRTPNSPISHLEGLNVKVDIRHQRRALTIDECQRLLTSTAQGPRRFKMEGSERALLYNAALESGLRANELKTLMVSCCRLYSDPPTLIVRAGYSKHRREDNQPIPCRLAEKLANFASNLADDDLLFQNMPEITNLAKMLRKDLEAALIPYCDDNGHVVDFHALRHTYITNLSRCGIHPKLAMDLARHSDINLTLAYYSHTLIEDRANALTSLPHLNYDEEEAVVGV